MTPRQYDRKHLNNLSDLDRRIARLFDQTINEIARWGILMDKPIGDKPFSFADYPHIKKRMDQLFDQFKSQTSTAIRNSLEREDALSADKAADLAAYYGQALAAKRSAAVQQIANRIVGGMNLSERIWRISDSFYKEIETALDIALRDGTPADRLATELKQYLRHPDKLFRRVRDEHGQLRLSKAAQAYHPGQGIYRSSFRNARRLAVTETNMAYHAADHERWQALDFVLGYEVQVSGTNPNVCPLCMELAGKYPKEFKFVGWHPHCRCHALPILEKPQAFKARQQALLRGKRIPPVGAVKAPPDNFTGHLANNTDRIASAQRNGTLPYYLRDNYKVAKDGTLTPTYNAQPIEARKQGTYGNKLGRKATKEARHEARTPEEERDIKRRLIQRNADIRHANRTPKDIEDIKRRLEESIKEQRRWKRIEERIKKRKIDALAVDRLKEPLSEDDIVSKISGGDLTKGSCSSLALTYAGNKRGLNVRDFRGGESQEFFSEIREIRKIARASRGIETKDFNGYKAAEAALKKMKSSKEYYFTAGSHAAIVRKAEGGGYEYLELQSPNAEHNGFHKLTKTELKERFGVETRRMSYGHKFELNSFLIDIEEMDEDALSSILRYINTEESKQRRWLSERKK